MSSRVEPVSAEGSAEASGRGSAGVLPAGGAVPAPTTSTASEEELVPERGHAEGGPALDGHPSCLDCGAPVLGAFCQSCGQRHGPPVQSMRTFFSEAAAELGGLDGRIFRTLRALLLQPGLLTTEYLHGRHTRYVPPFRLYLACSVVYFTLFFATGSTRFFFLWIGSDDPNVDLVTFLRRMPQAMFLLLPAFAAMVALLYRSRERLYAAHLVFALHFHAFAFLVLTVSVAMQPLLIARVASGATGVGGAVAALLAGVAELSVPVYLYLSLRRSYAASRLGTAARAVMLIMVHMILLGTVSLLTVPPLRDALWGAATGGR